MIFCQVWILVTSHPDIQKVVHKSPSCIRTGGLKNTMTTAVCKCMKSVRTSQVRTWWINYNSDVCIFFKEYVCVKFEVCRSNNQTAECKHSNTRTDGRDWIYVLPLLLTWEVNIIRHNSNFRKNLWHPPLYIHIFFSDIHLKFSSQPPILL